MNPPDRDPTYPIERWTNADDVALVRRMVDSDETALGALYDQWSQGLYSLVLHLLQDHDEAEDVVEETFWQAWRNAASYEPAKGAVSTWLLTIGRHRALDRLRVRKRNREDLSGASAFVDVLSPDPDSYRDVDGSDLRESVRGALRALPEEQRQPLELGYFTGLSQSEIAEAIGEPLGTVKTRVRLAMQTLREPLSVHRRGSE